MNTSLMSCERALTVLASGIDAITSEEHASARMHANRCRRCSSAYNPDLAEEVLHRFAHRPSEASAPLRIALAIVASAQLVLAVPWLLGYSLVPDAHVAVAHLTRDGALGLVIASLGLVTALRPRYVFSTRIIGVLVVAAQLVAGLTHEHMSPTRPSFEVVHLLVLVILFGLVGVGLDVARRATPENTPTSAFLRSLR